MAVTELTTQNFGTEALEAPGLVLVDFWAPWCGPCRMLSPVVDQIAEEQQDTLKVCKVNIDEQPELASQYGVMSIPTLLLLKDGNVTASSVGVRPKSELVQMIENAR